MTNIRPTAHEESPPQVLQPHPKNTLPLLNSFSRIDAVMASTSTKAADTKSILKPTMILKGHVESVRSISYFPDGQRMISGSWDKTARRWDLKAGKEIEKEQGICEVGGLVKMVVSSDGRWVVAGGGSYASAELKACEVETGIVKTFEGHSDQVFCIDISADSTLLASGSQDGTARVWNLETGKLVAGPFKSVHWVGAVLFSADSKKLAIKSYFGQCLEVWDVETQKLDVSIGKPVGLIACPPIFWTNKNKNILAAFNFITDSEDRPRTIYELDPSTLKTVGTPFEGHTDVISGLALSFDDTLLASASSFDDTIKLWAFESRQLLASFDVRNPRTLVLSPDSCQFAYTTSIQHDYNIYICNIPPEVLAQARARARTLDDLRNSNATPRRPAVPRRPPIPDTLVVQRSPPTIEPRKPIFHHLRKLLPFSSRTNAVRPVQPRNPLDVSATLPLPSPLLAQTVTRFDRFEIDSPPPPSNAPVSHFLRQHLSFLAPRHSHGPSVVEVAPGRKVTRLLAAKLPEYRKVNDTRHPPGQQAGAPQDIDSSDADSLPDVHWCKAFLCYCSCWSHGRPRMPPRWHLQRVEPRPAGTTNASSSRSGAHGGS